MKEWAWSVILAVLLLIGLRALPTYLNSYLEPSLPITDAILPGYLEFPFPADRPFLGKSPQ
jgi:hypothetical protein